MPRTSKIKKEDLNPSQKAVKKPRPVFYDGPKKNADPGVACDILTLYVGCKLGYSPIRHIIGWRNDKIIEDLVRHHMLGRKDVKGEKGELYCPGSTTMEEHCKPIVEFLAKKYHSTEDPYVAKLLATGKWSDDPAYKPKVRACPNCGCEFADDWQYCPKCGRNRDGDVQRKLF